MWETALAFALWGTYGSALTAAHIDPALTAITRSAGLGIILTLASVAIARTRGPREITAAIPWGSGALCTLRDFAVGRLRTMSTILTTRAAIGPPRPRVASIVRSGR